MSKLSILLVLGFILYVEAQYGTNRDWRSGRTGSRPKTNRRGPSVPDWCPNRSAQHCDDIDNPCVVNSCPRYPDAICLNDNPCEPLCHGCFYTERTGKLSNQECHGTGHTSTKIPDWCPLDSGRKRCQRNSCAFKTCPGRPDAMCLADNPCEPNCGANFYVKEGRGVRGRKLTRRECAATSRYGRRRT